MTEKLTEEQRLAWSHVKTFRHKKRDVTGMRLSGPSRTEILIWFDDRKKSTWVKLEDVEPIYEVK